MPTKRQFLLALGLLCFFLAGGTLFSCYQNSKYYEEVKGRVLTHDKFKENNQVTFYPAIEFFFEGKRYVLNLKEPSNFSNGEEVLLFYDREGRKLTTHSPWADSFYAAILLMLGWIFFFIGMMQRESRKALDHNSFQ